MNKRTSLAFLLALILLVGFTVTSVFSYVASSKLIRANLNDNELPLTGDNVYSEIQKDFLRPIFIASQMAQNTFMRDWVLRGQRDVAQLSRYLREVKTSYGTITAFLITDSNKTYYHFNAAPRFVREDAVSDAWYFKARQLQDAYEINVDQDQANRNALTIFINHRMLGYNNEFLGITGVGLTFNNISALLIEYERKYKRHIYFVDASGNVVISSRKSDLVSSNIKKIEGLQNIAATILSGKAEPLRLEYITSDESQSKRQVQLNSRYVPELKWHLLVEQDGSEAVQPVLRVLFINLGFSALAALLVFWLTLKAVRRHQYQLEGIANTDSLTGLLNRQEAQRQINRIIRQNLTATQQAAVLFFDVDHFKQINDSAGHLVGDVALMAVASCLKHYVPSNAVLARWGGEEFLVLIPRTSLDDAAKLAEIIRHALLSVRVAGLIKPASGPQMTISCGVGTFMRTETFESLFARVDEALYRAKANGRNRVEKSVVSNWGT
jgi:diguanylate cyclase (GGDEF)-like protein